MRECLGEDLVADHVGETHPIANKTELMVALTLMHVNPVHWGPDAAEFKPDRWIGRRPGWEFLPFNGGPRICLGQQFALTEAGYVIVRMLQKFDDIQTDESDPVVRHQYSLTTAPLRVSVRLHEAEG